MVMSFTDHKKNSWNDALLFYLLYDIVSKKYELFWPNLYDGVSK